MKSRKNKGRRRNLPFLEAVQAMKARRVWNPLGRQFCLTSHPSKQVPASHRRLLQDLLLDLVGYALRHGLDSPRTRSLRPQVRSIIDTMPFLAHGDLRTLNVGPRLILCCRGGSLMLR